MDVDALEPGVNFKEKIDESVKSVDALVAVIGRDWLTATDAGGKRRLDDPSDFVRLEIASALRRDIRVIPVLVEGARMPTQEELPDDLTGLAWRNALTISDLDWRSGAQKLVDTLKRVIAADAAPPAGDARERVPVAHPTPAVRRSGSSLLEVLGVALLALGPFVPWNNDRSFVRPSFSPYAGAEHAGIFTGLAPIGIAVGALIGVLLARRKGSEALGTGLVVAFGAIGTLKYLGAFWMSVKQEHDAIALGGTLLVAAGGALLVASGLRRASALRGGAPSHAASVLAAAGAALVFVATMIPFNGGGSDYPEQVLIHRAAGEVLEPLGTAVLLAIAAMLAWRGGSAIVGGLIVGLGVASTLLWIRYIGVPAIENSTVASVGVGGFVGLAGAVAAAVAGYVELGADAGEPAPARLSTP